MIHPDRSNPGARPRKGGVVVHCSQSGDGTSAALIALMLRPGDRPDGSGSSYQAIALENGAYEQVCDETIIPFSAPPLNPYWWHICMPGYAEQTRDEWLDPISRNYIKAVARFIFDKSKVDGFPMVKVGPVAMRAATPTGLNVGYCGHVEVTAAWHQTDHTDPGGFFPWDVLELELVHLIFPDGPPQPPLPRPPHPKDTDMADLIQPDDGDPAIFTTSGGMVRWMPDHETINMLAFDGQLATTSPRGVNRSLFRSSMLVGPAPVYPVSYRGPRTTAGDFEAVA